MCGLTAIFAYHNSAPPVDREELLQIREAMISRGPNGAGLWISDHCRVGLAHRRLAIIDLTDAGAQPMATADGTVHIVFNGEIYNYRKLRDDLEAKGYHFHSHSDTEVLLYLYQDRGRGFVHCLRGMYAFAMWDERKQGLLLARDPFGIKPLYYSDNGSTIRVASQVKALLKGGHIDTAPEPAGHVGFYLWGHVPEPYTFYQDVHALPPGTTLWVDTTGRKETRQFFDIKEEVGKASTTPLSVTTREEMREYLRTSLLDSVRHHLIADVPVGVFLSSGLDSTTLVALAKEVADGELHTITLGFREFLGSKNDETRLAEVAARHYGTVHQTRWVTKEDFEREYQHLLDVMDQPTIDGVNSYFVSQAAAVAGHKVALSGLGGDELFGGYPSFQQIPRLARTLGPSQFVSAFSKIFGRGFRYISASFLKHFTSPKYAGLLEYGSTYGGAYLLRRGLFMPWELPDLLDGEIVRQGWGELQTMARLEETIRGISNSHLKVSALETTWYMRNQLLRDADWASLAHSLEIRVPLVDVELFRVAASLSSSAYPPTKLDMAKLPLKALPDEILRHRKTGFLIPIEEWSQQRCGASGGWKGVREWAQRLYGYNLIPLQSGTTPTMWPRRVSL